MSEEEKEAMNENEIKFRAYLLILNSEFPTHRKAEAMEELLKINNKQRKEIERQAKEIGRQDKNIHKLNLDKIQQQKEIEKLKEENAFLKELYKKPEGFNSITRN